MFKSYTMELGGRPLTLEFGKYAEQASGSTFVRYGDTCVLVNATVAETPRPGIDFFPLSVDFEEKLYSVGRIPGSWNRREGRPAEKAILTSRLIDRPLRPLFPKGMRHDVAVVATVMSVDQDNIPDIPAMIGASAARSTSAMAFRRSSECIRSSSPFRAKAPNFDCFLYYQNQKLQFVVGFCRFNTQSSCRRRTLARWSRAGHSPCAATARS